MQPCFSEDFHFVALCLKHQLASAAQLKALFTRQANEPAKTLGDLLVEEGILTPDQHRVILERMVRVVEVEQALDPRSGREFAARIVSAPAGSEIQQPRTNLSATVSSDIEPMPVTRKSPGLPSQSASNSDLSATPSHSDDETVVISEIFDKDNLDSLDKLSSDKLSSGSAAGFAGRSWSASLDSLGGSGRAGSSVSFSDAFKKSHTGEDVVGTEIAGHIIEGHLGRGGQGQVYRARQLSLNRIVALKVLPLEMAKDVSFINRFIAEARTLATFTHPNIVQVYDVGVSDGVFYFTMEAVKGQSLKDLLQTQGRVPVDVAVNLMKQCLRGLDRAARAGIIHRDIKPGNILIDDEGILKLVDFGLAEKCDAEGILGSSQVVGTPLYISPEQIAGKDISSKSDQYSLGATFFHLLTGGAPFTARSVKEVMRKHKDAERPDACALVPEIHPELGTILQRMMAKTAAERYPSFQELFRVLEDFELRHGLIESRSSFLAEGLMNIGERSVRRLWSTVSLLATLGVGLTALAVGMSVMLDRLGWMRAKDFAGDIGATLLFMGFAAIMYIAGVRKRLFPRLGNVKTWLELHIALALAGFFLSMIHSGNFLNFFKSYVTEDIGGLGQSYHVVPWIPFLNSTIFTIVIISGLVGRYIWRDIARQIATEQIQRGLPKPEETHELTLAIFAQKALRYWRIFHYPMAFALVTVTIVHIFSILYYGS